LPAVRARNYRILITLTAGVFGMALAATHARAQTKPAATSAGNTTAASGAMGVDLTRHPGDSALRAWKFPASPYQWIGYYLAAPCRRDSSWVGKRASIQSAGWNTVPIYVGQQDWASHPVMPVRKPPVDTLAARTPVTPASPIAPPSSTVPSPPKTAAPTPAVRQQTGACSGQFLTAAQGTTEAADAVAKLRAEGFANGSVVYLDVEQVTTVTQALLDYYRAWVAGVLADGTYRVGVYAAKSNAQALYDAAMATYRVAGRADRPDFWVASVPDFLPTLKPTDVGFYFAKVWQGQIGVAQTFNGVTLNVDVNISAVANPGAP
jgi:hypothetical protein